MMNSLGKSFFLKWRKSLFVKVLAKDRVDMPNFGSVIINVLVGSQVIQNVHILSVDCDDLLYAKNDVWRKKHFEFAEVIKYV